MVRQVAPQVHVQRSFSRPSFGQPVFHGGPQLRAPGLVNTQGLHLAPTRRGPSFAQPSAPVLQQTGPLAGSYASNVSADGSYWEKVSGPTAFGSTIATQVICKRKLPTRVVNPVVGVPVPVPVAVPQECRQDAAAAPAARYGQTAPGRWIY